MKTLIYTLCACALLAACGPNMRDGAQKDSETLADRMQRFTMGLDDPQPKN